MSPGRLARRLRRALGLPPVSKRAWLVITLLFLGLVVAAVLLADFALRSGGYAPPYYEPKDFQREEQVQRESAKPPVER